MSIIQRSLQLTEHASATILHKRRVAFLSKVNKAVKLMCRLAAVSWVRFA